MPDIAKIRSDLVEIAAYRRNHPYVQGEAVDAARAANLTWREIAHLLDMTEHGLIKAQRRYREYLAGRSS
jgi:hypothetical protein